MWRHSFSTPINDNYQSDPPISLRVPCLPVSEAGKSEDRERGDGESEGTGKKGNKKSGNAIRGKDQQGKSQSRESTADSDSRRRLWQKTTQIFFWKYFSHLMLVSGLLLRFDLFVRCIVFLCTTFRNSHANHLRNIYNYYFNLLLTNSNNFWASLFINIISKRLWPRSLLIS